MENLHKEEVATDGTNEPDVHTLSGLEAPNDATATDEGGALVTPEAAPLTFDDAREIAEARGVRREVREAALSLLELARKNASDGENGFGFGDTASEGPEALRASGQALRLCRALLEQLEADLRAVKDEQTEWFRGQLRAFEALDLDGEEVAA